MTTAGFSVGATLGCDGTDEKSVEHALAHANHLTELARGDVSEIRRGLPLGARQLAKQWGEGARFVDDPEAAREALARARNKIQDLRIAKSTFFALARANGEVIRNDREQDAMAGQMLFDAFPALRARGGEYAEATGVWEAAHGVRGKPDAEWVATCGVQTAETLHALYVTGWAWSSYCYRLEFSLRAEIKRALAGTQTNVPLLYCFALVGKGVYSAPEAPEVSAQAIAKLDPMAHLSPDGKFSKLLEITGRKFAFAAQLEPKVAAGVGFGVLRSET